MASPTQLVQFTFAGGIDQASRPEVVDPTVSFLVRENVRQPSRGEADKRLGFDPHTGQTRADSSSRTAGYRQFPFGKQTCVIDRNIIDTFAPDNESLIARGRVPDCGLSFMKAPAPPGQGAIAISDSLRVGDYFVIVGTSADTKKVYTTVLEAETGQIVLPFTAVATGSVAQIYGLLGQRSNEAMLFVAEQSSSTIRVFTLTCTNATTILAGWSAGTSATTADGLLAMAVASAGGRVYLAFANNSGGASRLTVNMYDGGAGATVNVSTSSVSPVAVALGITAGDTLWAVFDVSTTIEMIGLSPTTLSTTVALGGLITSAAPASFAGLAVTPGATGAGQVFVATSSGTVYRWFASSGGSVTSAGAQVSVFNTFFQSRPFYLGTRYYAVCRGYADAGDFVLCDMTEENAWVRPVANLPPRLSYGIGTVKASEHTSREFWFPFVIRTAGSVYGCSVAKFDFDADARWRPVSHNGLTFLSGGLVGCFDGQRVFESGFVLQPPAPSLSTNGTGSFSASVGIRVVITYEHVDAVGNWHLSGVSAPVSSGAFSSKVNLAVAVRPLSLSARISATIDPAVRIGIWATKDGGEAPYYLVTTLSNDLSAATTTYNMTAAPTGSEALLMGTGNLPNTGAQLDRRAPQGLAHLCAYNGFLIGANNEEVFWTGQDIDGEGAWWNDAFSMAVTGGGPITALDAIDGTAFAFKRDRIFAMAGIPPLDNGADGGLGPPQRLSVSIGARSPFTCVTEIGIFFVSDRGVELLTRSRSVEWVGEAIKDTFDAYPYVSAMTYDQATSSVIIEASEGRSGGLPTGDGVAFIFDTRSRIWQSVDRRTVTSTADVPASDGCMLWDGTAMRYGWLRSNGVTYIEADHYLDPGDAWITKRAKTSFVKLGGIQGQQVMNRVLLLAKRLGVGDIKMAATYDYATTAEAPVEWTSATTTTLSTALQRVQVEHSLHTSAEGQAVSVEVYDEAPSGGVGDGRGATWIALTFEGQPRPNAAQLSQEAR